MHEPIELTLESPDGLVDCQLERIETETEVYYSATILYPHLEGGRIMSKVYEHDLILDPATGMYYFAAAEMVHPKVYALESQLSKAIARAMVS